MKLLTKVKKQRSGQEARRLYNSRAKLYDSLMRQLGYIPAIEALLAKLPIAGKPRRVLDIGCGTGLATGVLLERFPEVQITGLDCSEKMLFQYRRKHPRARAMLGDFNQPETLPLPPDAAFDLVVSTGAVSEYGDLSRALPFIARLLAPGGAFINIGVKKNVVNDLCSRLWLYTPIRNREFMASCRNAGFSRVKEVKIPWAFFPSNLLRFVVEAGK